VNARYNTRDWFWIAVVAAAFLFGLAASWQRWDGPLIDCGREMNQPLRLASGEQLYSDVRHIYGPLSPYFHAALYRFFGPSLGVLYADGILSAAVVLALVYGLSRRIMSPVASATATLSVMWLCAFKPAGNYFLPYSFNALHGTVLGLLAVAILAAATRSDPDSDSAAATHFAVAGVVSGLSLLAKTELGLSAIAAGIVAAVLSGGGRHGRQAKHLLIFLAGALAVAAGGYGVVVAHVGVAPLVGDSWLLWYNVPPGLKHYNQWVSGLDHPVRSVTRMTIALAKVAALAAILAAISQLVARWRGTGGAPAADSAMARLVMWSPARALLVAAAILAVLGVTTGFDWDKGPYLAMPFLLAGLIWMERRRLSDADPHRAVRARLLILYAVFALVCLGRMILHVRSGGAYGSFLGPMSMVLFTYLWAEPFGDWLEASGAGRAGATIAVALILVDLVVTAGILAHRYRTRYQTPIVTSKGTLIAQHDVGQAWNEALAFIASRTQPSDFVAVMPEGTSLDFMSGRRNPLREEIVTPGYLDGPNEARAIAQLEASRAPLVLITNRATKEFGANAFGRDYAREMMRFIELRYEPCAMFGPKKDQSLQIGDRPFFIKAYCRR
jgi:Dolichyl-phosphate-mannose-protein mannosyltransferase